MHGRGRSQGARRGRCARVRRPGTRPLVQNDRALEPLVLDVTSTFYSHWCESFLLVLGKYSLQGHVLTNTATSESQDWIRMNCVVRSWLMDTLSFDPADTVMERDATARVCWLAIESQFLDNREMRVLFLDAKFRSFTQGNLSITDYCRRFKNMTDSLCELSENTRPQRDPRPQRSLQGHRHAPLAWAPLPLLPAG
jgi:hypothetical protein